MNDTKKTNFLCLIMSQNDDFSILKPSAINFFLQLVIRSKFVFKTTDCVSAAIKWNDNCLHWRKKWDDNIDFVPYNGNMIGQK